jgi:hypothetical protein
VASAVQSLRSNRPEQRVLRFEAQPTRMFGAYNVTAHYTDGTKEALAYGTPNYCIAEAKRRNAELPADAGAASKRNPDTHK